MVKIRAGGDPESYMDAPEISVGSDGPGGPSIIASLLDLVGLHRQVAKGPKVSEVAQETNPLPRPQASVPQVVADVESALIPQETPLLPEVQNAPMSTWGQRWIDSIRPLTSIDPDSTL